MTPLLKVKLNRRRDKVHIERGVRGERGWRYNKLLLADWCCSALSSQYKCLSRITHELLCYSFVQSRMALNPTSP